RRGRRQRFERRQIARRARAWPVDQFEIRDKAFECTGERRAAGPLPGSLRLAPAAEIESPQIRARAETIRKLEVIQHAVEKLQQTMLPLHRVFIPSSLREFVNAPG